MQALVIDDSRAMRMILGRILREAGFEVAEAGNGREGLEQLRHMTQPQVALVDWNMPEMNGLDFVRAVRADPAYNHVPLMMVTTETELTQVAKALEAGANEYVMKPFTTIMIREKLELLGVTADATGTQDFQPTGKEAPMCALVIDDSRAMRMILGQILKKLGFEVIEAADGQEGLRRLREAGRPHVALVDWNMPDMNGVEFVRAVRADPTYDGMRVLMVSAEEERAQVTQALAAGANEYVLKPFTRDVIRNKLEQLGVVPANA